MGVLLGGYIDDGVAGHGRRVVVPRLRRPRAARRHRDAGGDRRGDVAGHGRDQVGPDLPRDDRLARCASVDIVVGAPRLRDVPGARWPAACSPACSRSFGVFTSVARVRSSRWLARVLAGPRVRDAGLRLQRGSEDRAGVRADLPARSSSRCSCSPARSSRSRTSPSRCEWAGAGSPRCGTASSWPGWARWGPGTGRRVVHVGYLGRPRRGRHRGGRCAGSTRRLVV